jgi:hypothetical protein
VPAGHGGEIPQVSRVRGEDLVAIVGEEDDRRVDYVGSARGAQEDTRLATQIVVEGLNVNTR